MAGGGEAAAEARRLHPRWWPVRWEGKITQAPPALPALDATLHYHGDAQVAVEEAALARRQPIPIPVDWQRPSLVMCCSPRLVRSNQRREAHKEATHSTLDEHTCRAQLSQLGIEAGGKRGRPRTL